MYKKYGDISNKTANDTPQPSQIDLDERKEEDHEILVTIALLNPDARFQVFIFFIFFWKQLNFYTSNTKNISLNNMLI